MMSHQRIHAIEKKQVQLATAVGLIVVYFFLWSFVRNWDPGAPITIVADGGYGAFWRLAAILGGLAALCGIATIRTRPAGALLATLLGALAVSLRSSPAHMLLWSYEDNLRQLFAKLIAEVLLLGLLAICAGLVICVVRWAVGLLNPNWRWRPRWHAEEAHDEDAVIPDREGPAAGWANVSPLLWALIAGARKTGTGRRQQGASKMLLGSLYCTGLGVPLAIGMILLVMQSAERGQIVFALLASFCVAAMVAYHTFPVPSSVPAMAMVVVSAVALYGLSAAMSISGKDDVWMRVDFFAHALPVDWLTAGGGGAVLGYWIISRIREARRCEELEQETKGR